MGLHTSHHIKAVVKIRSWGGSAPYFACKPLSRHLYLCFSLSLSLCVCFVVWILLAEYSGLPLFRYWVIASTDTDVVHDK